MEKKPIKAKKPIDKKPVPVNSETDEIYNFLAGKGTVAGDVVSPAISPRNRIDLSRSSSVAFRKRQ